MERNLEYFGKSFVKSTVMVKAKIDFGPRPTNTVVQYKPIYANIDNELCCVFAKSLYAHYELY